MAFAGLRGTGSWATDERPKNFRELILWSNPNGKAPLTALMARARKQTVDDPEFSWWEETQDIVRVTMDATGASASSTAFGLTSGGFGLVPGDVLQVEKTETAVYDAEIVTVSSVTSDTAIVVRRGQAGSSAAATGASANLTKIGNVYEEASRAPSISLTNPAKKKNFTQIFKTKLGMSGSAKETRTRTGDPWGNDKKRKAFSHSVSIEEALFFGRPFETTGPNGFPLRFTGGLRNFLTTNTKVYTTTPTESTFLDDVHKVFDYTTGGAGDERLVFAGNGFLNGLNKMVLNSTSTRINYQGQIDIFGMNLMKYVLPQGVLAIKSHPLLNVHPKYKFSAFIIDPTGLVYRPLRGRDTRFQDNIQENDEDARMAQWITEAGFEIQHEETMQYLGNFVV